MTLMKRSSRFPLVPSLFDDFWTRDLFNWNDFSSTGTTVPAVNIQETNDEFLVEMAAPGMKKSDFKIELNNDMLTIGSEHQQEHKDEDGNFTRREFSYQSFSRSFYLPKTVEADKIEAKYTDGVLRLVIPKREEARQKPVKQIAIK